MSKTVPISVEAHELIIKKQAELYKKHRFSIRISDIVDVLIEKHICELENDLGLKSEQQNLGS